MNNKSRSQRVTAAVYFAIISVPLTLLVQLFLFHSNMLDWLTAGISLLLSITLAYILGWVFGSAILNTQHPYKLKCFFWGLLYSVAFIVIYTTFLVFLLNDSKLDFQHLKGLQAFVVTYLYIFIYSLLVVFSWLSPLIGAATIYLRHRFMRHLNEFKAQHNPKH